MLVELQTQSSLVFMMKTGCIREYTDGQRTEYNGRKEKL